MSGLTHFWKRAAYYGLHNNARNAYMAAKNRGPKVDTKQDEKALRARLIEVLKECQAIADQLREARVAIALDDAILWLGGDPDELTLDKG